MSLLELDGHDALAGLHKLGWGRHDGALSDRVAILSRTCLLLHRSIANAGQQTRHPGRGLH